MLAPARRPARLSAVPEGEDRRRRLAAARLYFIGDGAPGGRPLAGLLERVLAAGVDVFQLRDKRLGDDELRRVGAEARAVCERHGALLIVNDRPDIAVDIGADGVHVGQDDLPAAQAREIVGEALLVGLSTHTPAQIDAARGVDYIGVGPVNATPTKPGRPAVGTTLVEYAAAHAPMPFFAIGGIDADRAGAVIAAGARRVAVVRALAEAADPAGAARELAAILEAAGAEAGVGAA